MMWRFENVPVPPPTRYFMVKTFEPAVSVSNRWNIPNRFVFPAVTPSWRAHQSSFAAMVVALDTATETRHWLLSTLLDMFADQKTIARVPVVAVTEGPTVV